MRNLSKPPAGMWRAVALALSIVTSCPSARARASRPLDELFSSKLPALPRPLTQIDLTMTPDQVRKRLPKLVEGAWAIRSEEFSGVTFRIEVDFDSNYRSRPINGISVQISDAEKAKRALERAWGTGVVAAEGLVWFNPASGLRVHLLQLDKDALVIFRRYIPVEKLLGTRGERLEMETTEILGKTLAELKRNYSLEKDSAGGPVIRLLPSDWSIAALGTKVDLKVDENMRVCSFGVELPYGEQSAFKAKLRELFNRKWGPSPEMRWRLPNRRVTVDDDEAGLTYWVNVAPVGE